MAVMIFISCASFVFVVSASHSNHIKLETKLVGILSHGSLETQLFSTAELALNIELAYHSLNSTVRHCSYWSLYCRLPGVAASTYNKMPAGHAAGCFAALHSLFSTRRVSMV